MDKKLPIIISFFIVVVAVFMVKNFSQQEMKLILGFLSGMGTVIIADWIKSRLRKKK